MKGYTVLEEERLRQIARPLRDLLGQRGFEEKDVVIHYSTISGLFENRAGNQVEYYLDVFSDSENPSTRIWASVGLTATLYLSNEDLNGVELYPLGQKSALLESADGLVREMLREHVEPKLVEHLASA